MVTTCLQKKQQFPSCALAREQEVLTHPIPSTQLQARHQVAALGPGVAEGGIQHEELSNSTMLTELSSLGWDCG